jgi:hypothetical protein
MALASSSAMKAPDVGGISRLSGIVGVIVPELGHGNRSCSQLDAAVLIV